MSQQETPDVPPSPSLPPPPHSQPASYHQGDPGRMVAAPAIALIVVGGLDLLGGILLTAAHFLSISIGTGLLRLDDMGSDEVLAQFISGVFGLFLCVLGLILTSVIIFGAVRMLQLRSWGIAMAAAILALIPCISPCCVLGIPFGIWAIVVLQNPEVRAAFQST